MAPTIPTTPRRRTLLPKSTRPTPTPSPSTSTTPTLRKEPPSTSLLGRSSKRDKRTIKHSALLSRISKSYSTSKSKKRRRPSKKLVTGLEELGDALPEAPALTSRVGKGGGDGDGDGDGEGGKRGGVLEREGEGGVNGGVQIKIRHKSLGSRPGRAKRREKEVRGERERFGVNMARMMAGGGGGGGDGEEGGKSKERWKALRGFIEGTMERRGDRGG